MSDIEDVTDVAKKAGPCWVPKVLKTLTTRAFLALGRELVLSHARSSNNTTSVLFLKLYYMGTWYCHHSPNQVFAYPTRNNGDCSENLPSVQSISGSLGYRLSSSRLLARRAKVGHLKASPSPYSLLSLQSLISSTILTSRPTLPRLSVGGGRTVPVPVYPRGSPRPV